MTGARQTSGLDYKLLLTAAYPTGGYLKRIRGAETEGVIWVAFLESFFQGRQRLNPFLNGCGGGREGAKNVHCLYYSPV